MSDWLMFVLPRVAVMLPLVCAVTDFVVMMKLPVLAPSATVTFAGATPAGLVLVRFTTVPPAGAGPLKVTTPPDC